MHYHETLLLPAMVNLCSQVRRTIIYLNNILITPVQGITTGGGESSQFPGDAVHNNHTKSQKLPTQQLQLLGFQTDKVVPSTGEDP